MKFLFLRTWLTEFKIPKRVEKKKGRIHHWSLESASFFRILSLSPSSFLFSSLFLSSFLSQKSTLQSMFWFPFVFTVVNILLLKKGRSVCS